MTAIKLLNDEWVRRLIVEQISSFLVLPKSVFVPLADPELLAEASALLGRANSVSGESAPSFQEWNLLRVTVVEVVLFGN